MEKNIYLRNLNRVLTFTIGFFDKNYHLWIDFDRNGRALKFLEGNLHQIYKSLGERKSKRTVQYENRNRTKLQSKRQCASTSIKVEPSDDSIIKRMRIDIIN